MNNYAFGNYICTLREKKGLSQAELGKLLGVSNKAVSKWETGASYPSTEIMLPLAEALGTTIEELYTVVSQSKTPRSKLRVFLDIVFSYDKIWLPIIWGVALLCYGVYLLFGASEQKLTLAIASPIIAAMVYGFLRLLFFILMKNPLCPSGFLNLMEIFFFVGFGFFFLQAIVLFATDLIYGFSPSLLASCAVLTGIAHAHAKRIK